MKRISFLRLVFFTLVGVLGAATVQAEEATKEREFGSWTAIVFDHEYIQNVRVSGDDIFIMLQPDHRNAQLTMRNSMQLGGPYRKWFTGEEIFVAQENSGRAANTWTDRMQTSANYLEYYAGETLFLRLKRK
jgi:hypothetical protein